MVRLVTVLVLGILLAVVSAPLPADAGPVADEAPMPVCRFAIPPWQKGVDFKEIRKKYMPLMRYMTEKSGCRFVAVGAKDYDDLVAKLVSGKVMVAELGAVTYIRAKNLNAAIEPLATVMSWNHDKSALVDYYNSYIVSLRNNKEVKTLHDLKGKPFGFVNRRSSSGFLYPSRLLMEEGVDYERFFGRTFFLGSHANVTDAVVAGSIAAGTSSQNNLLKAIKKHGDIFKVLWKSPPIPNVLFASHPEMPEAVRRKVQEALPLIDSDRQDLPLRHRGFSIRPDSFYDVTRKIM
ncbi:MAG: phosphate/phosphite/phosphonate ABC transporter substrate-binding protein [Magnetococcales bacterium]|nr:phosphate/phosphite/phosphonate ABC transporter substrate-binding protein [Magnetococcales bacterium]